MGYIEREQMSRPLKGIMMLNEWPDAESYRISCDCMTPDHDIVAWIEIKELDDVQEVELTIYADTWTPFWDSGLKGLWFRIKAAYNILFKGVMKMEHEMILGKEQALNVAYTLNSTVARLDQQMKGNKNGTTQ